MSTELVKTESAELKPLIFNTEQRQLIRDTYANGASEQEFRVLLAIAQKRNLDPLMRQIHFVKRWDGEKKREVWSAQVSIDGLRAIAERSGKYDGQDEPEFEYGDNGQLILARVRVYRKDWARPSVGLAHMQEYVQTNKEGNPTSFWRNKPHIMLAKCAESIAIRKAFPEDTSGLYTPEEMSSSALPAHESHVSVETDDDYSQEDTSFAMLKAKAIAINNQEDYDRMIPLLKAKKNQMSPLEVEELVEIIKNKSNTFKKKQS